MKIQWQYFVLSKFWMWFTSKEQVMKENFSGPNESTKIKSIKVSFFSSVQLRSPDHLITLSSIPLSHVKGLLFPKSAICPSGKKIKEIASVEAASGWEKIQFMPLTLDPLPLKASLSLLLPCPCPAPPHPQPLPPPALSYLLWWASSALIMHIGRIQSRVCFMTALLRSATVQC